jgi:outer membrane protein assembly factor BamB
VFAVIVSSLVLETDATESWLQFRGPQGDGVVEERSLPKTWTETSNVRWYAKLPGLGWSSPVVIGDRVYLTAAVSSSSDERSLAGPQSLRLLCVKLDSGEMIFDREIFQQSADAPSPHKKNSHASPTPIYDGERLIVHYGHQGTAAVDLDGQVLWSNRDHTFPPTHGNGGSPIIVDDKLIVTCDGGEEPYTLALNRQTGKEVWRTPREAVADRKFSFCTPSCFEIDGKLQLISPGSNIVQSLDPVDGRVLWHVDYDGYSVIPKPIHHQGLIFVCTGYGPTTLYAIDPTGSGSVTKSHVRWTLKSQTVPKTPSLIAYREIVILCSDQGIVAGVDAKSGKEVWKARIGGNYSASPLLNGRQIYFQSEGGESILMELGETGLEEPRELARGMLPGRTFASYAVVDNDLLVRAEEGLYRIGEK